MKPMLAAKTTNIKKVFDGKDKLLSYKYDGIRCLNIDNTAISRSGKEMRNRYIQNKFKELPNIVFDGELIIGNGTDTFSSNTEGIMTIKAELPNLRFLIFDIVSDDIAYTRYEKLLEVKDTLPDWCEVVTKEICVDYESYLEYYQQALSKGYEGVMIQSIDGKYKQGRSTLKEGYLIKTKEIIDLECIVIGFTQKHLNENESFSDELGYSKKSSAQEGLVPVDELGALVCETLKSDMFDAGVEFKIGTGFDITLRKEIWENKDKYLNKVVTFKTLAIGALNKPRNPVFIKFRDELDI